jgi:ribonuclease E
MGDEQELVYGWLGLNPGLLLDPPPSGDNLMVRIVRPGEDAEAVLEQARQQLAASGSRRRRRGRGSGGEAAGAERGESFERGGEAATASPVASVTITPLPVPSAEDFSPAEVVTVAVPVQRRTRTTAAAVAEPTEAPEATDTGGRDGGGDSDPRRRRRRSSATV